MANSKVGQSKIAFNSVFSKMCLFLTRSSIHAEDKNCLQVFKLYSFNCIHINEQTVLMICTENMGNPLAQKQSVATTVHTTDDQGHSYT